MAQAELTLPGVPSSVTLARHFVQDELMNWGLANLIWTATLLVSELAANSTLHARTDFTVRVALTDTLRIEVTDGSLRTPTQRQYGADAVTGRGLLLVEELASRWGIRELPQGKTVWVELFVPPVGGRRTTPQVDAEPDVEALLRQFGDDGFDEPRTSDHTSQVQRLRTA